MTDQLYSRDSDGGRIEDAINYRERQVSLSVTEQTTVRNVARAMGVELTKTPTGETANILLLRLHGEVCNAIAYASQQMQAADAAGHHKAFIAWKAWREPWYPEKIRIELALKGMLTGPIGRN